MLRVYSYRGCDSCRKSIKWLDENNVEFESIAIRETPPSRSELKIMLGCYDGNLRRLFNVSGTDYRKLKLKDQLSSLSVDEAIELLESNGNLVKRPFAIKGNWGTVGFNPSEWLRFLEI